jgi:subtilisin family serine protease
MQKKMRYEPKLFSGATIDQDFCGSSVLVVMDKSVSKINKVYDSDFFDGFEIDEIVDLTIVVNESLLVADDYRPLPTESNWAIDYVDVGANMELTREIRVLEEIDDENWRINRDDFRQILQIKLPVDCKENVLKVIAALESVEGVKSAESSYHMHISAANPNDPYFTNGSQWALTRIRAPGSAGAWGITTGSNSVRVGIVDMGLAVHNSVVSQDDLEANVNRSLGWNFVNNNNVTTRDRNGHGTMTAGIIGAVGNNGRGKGKEIHVNQQLCPN